MGGWLGAANRLCLQGEGKSIGKGSAGQILEEEEMLRRGKSTEINKDKSWDCR